MEYKIKKTYEIIEYSPTVLKTNIPILDIFFYTIFFLGTPIYFLFRTFKTKESFFNLFNNKNEFKFKGPEIKFSKLTNLKGDEIIFNPKDIIETEIIFHKNKNAFSILRLLLNKGYSINTDLLSNHFLIKEKTEYINLYSNKDISEEVLFSSPEFAEKIAKFFKLKK